MQKEILNFRPPSCLFCACACPYAYVTLFSHAYAFTYSPLFLCSIFPVDGDWSVWTEWTLCSKVCNGGEQTRSRECNNPAPQHGGNDCLGHKRDTRPCNVFACPGKTIVG